MRSSRSMLPFSATIPSGKIAEIVAKPREAFRPERILISPHSFAVPALRRFWTWPILKVGSLLTRTHRGLVRLLRVKPTVPKERHERVDDDYVTPEGVEEDIFEDEYDGHRYRRIVVPLNLRERFLGTLSRAATYLTRMRLRWQEEQLGYLTITDVKIGSRAAMESIGPLPGDMFAAGTLDNFVTFGAPCAAGHDITITIKNDSPRECGLLMTIIGTTQS